FRPSPVYVQPQRRNEAGFLDALAGSRKPPGERAGLRADFRQYSFRGRALQLRLENAETRHARGGEDGWSDRCGDFSSPRRSLRDRYSGDGSDQSLLRTRLGRNRRAAEREGEGCRRARDGCETCREQAPEEVNGLGCFRNQPRVTMRSDYRSLRGIKERSRGR